MVLIEAMAYGVPVIAWNHGAVAEIVEHGITGFIVADCGAAAAAVGACDGLDRDRIRARFVERFSADRMTDDYLALYRRIRRQH